MTYENLQNIFQVPHLKPWEHDYYEARFTSAINMQEFLDLAHSKIEGLTNIWYEISGNIVHFIVPKGIVIPEDFAEQVEIITDVPEEPPVKETTEEGKE
jgi:hypothetical protein